MMRREADDHKSLSNRRGRPKLESAVARDQRANRSRNAAGAMKSASLVVATRHTV